MELGPDSGTDGVVSARAFRIQQLQNREKQARESLVRLQNSTPYFAHGRTEGRRVEMRCMGWA